MSLSVCDHVFRERERTVYNQLDYLFTLVLFFSPVFRQTAPRLSIVANWRTGGRGYNCLINSRGKKTDSNRWPIIIQEGRGFTENECGEKSPELGPSWVWEQSRHDASLLPGPPGRWVPHLTSRFSFFHPSFLSLFSLPSWPDEPVHLIYTLLPQKPNSVYIIHDLLLVSKAPNKWFIMFLHFKKCLRAELSAFLFWCFKIENFLSV